MGRKAGNSDKKNKPKTKKKDFEFNFTSLRRGLSQKGKKELIEFFSNAKQVFSQSKEELFQLNKRFDNMEFVFKQMIKKDNMNIGSNQEPMMKERQDQPVANNMPMNDENDFVLSDELVALIFNEENTKEEDKGKGKERQRNSNEEDEDEDEEDNESGDDEDEFDSGKKKKKTRQEQKTMISNQKNKPKDYEMIQDDFDKKDSSESNDIHMKMPSNANNDNSQSKGFVQKLFDYKSFSSSQNKKNNSPNNQGKSAKISNPKGSWINK